MNRTLTNILFVLAADVLVKVVSASTAFLVARLLTPAEYGTWMTLILVVSYAPIASLGTVETLVKQYPYYAGRGDAAMARRVEVGVLSAVTLAAMILLGAGFGILTALGNRIDADSRHLLEVMLVTSALAFMSAFFYYRFSAHQTFRFLSAIDATRAVVTSGCLVALTWRFGLVGTVVGFFLAELSICLTSLWLSLRQNGRLRVSFDVSLMWEMVKVGFPITLIWWVFIIQSSADRLISMSMLGDQPTGFYGLGVSIVSLIVLLPMTISRVLYPKVNERVGQVSQPHELRGLVVLPSQALSVFIPAAIGLLVIASPFVYRDLMPKYGPGLRSAQILMLGSFFLCIVRTGANFLVATNRQNTVLKYVLISLAINVTGNIMLARAGFGIEGIAFGSSASACVLATLVWLDVFKEMGHLGFERLRELGRLYLPYAGMVSLLTFVGAVLPGVFENPRAGLVTAAALFIVMFPGLMCLLPAIRVPSTRLVGLLRTGLTGRAAL